MAQLGEIVHALRATQRTWLTAAALTSAATYPMAAIQNIGTAGTRLLAGRTILAQVASAAANVGATGGPAAPGSTSGPWPLRPGAGGGLADGRLLSSRAGTGDRQHRRDGRARHHETS